MAPAAAPIVMSSMIEVIAFCTAGCPILLQGLASGSMILGARQYLIFVVANCVPTLPMNCQPVGVTKNKSKIEKEENDGAVVFFPPFFSSFLALLVFSSAAPIIR
jgi:hypothetical protein